MKEEFDGFKLPSEGRIKAMWDHAEISLDASSLLDLYRMPEDGQNAFLGVLQRLKRRLWLPYQAGLEFHTNRIAVRESAPLDHLRAVQILNEASVSIQSDIGSVNPAPNLDIEKLNRRIDKYFKGLIRELEAARSACGERIQATHQEDPILEQLEKIFQSRTGAPYEEAADLRARKEANKRIKHLQPPGFADAAKPQDQRHGDYFVWSQMIDRAKDSGRDMIFVTSDAKQDWWHISGGDLRGPRHELITEFRQETGREIHFYLTKDFVSEASERIATSTTQARAWVDASIDLARIASELQKSQALSDVAIGNVLAAVSWQATVKAISQTMESATRAFNSPLHPSLRSGGYRRWDPATDAGGASYPLPANRKEDEDQAEDESEG